MSYFTKKILSFKKILLLFIALLSVRNSAFAEVDNETTVRLGNENESSDSSSTSSTSAPQRGSHTVSIPLNCDDPQTSNFLRAKNIYDQYCAERDRRPRPRDGIHRTCDQCRGPGGPGGGGPGPRTR